MTEELDLHDWVGPVLQKGPAADAVVAAIRSLDPEVRVVDRGAYVRVLARRRCRLVRKLVEDHAHAPFVLPSDLEMIMSSFKGRLELSEEEAVFWLVEGAAHG